jgi:hypothetical protein
MRYLTPPRGVQFTFFISFLAFGEELEKICFMMCLSDLMLLCSLVFELVSSPGPPSFDSFTLSFPVNEFDSINNLSKVSSDSGI